MLILQICAQGAPKFLEFSAPPLQKSFLRPCDQGNFFIWNESGGGMSHWGLSIICVNHFLKSTLNEDEARVSTALWTLHHACAPKYRSQISYPFRGSSADLSGDLWIWYPFFLLHIFPLSIPLTRYARYAPGGVFLTSFYWRGWCCCYIKYKGHSLFEEYSTRMMYRPIDLYTRTLDSALSIQRTQIRRQNLKGGAHARNRAKLLPGTWRGIGMHGYRCKFITTPGDNIVKFKGA